jgi:manganese/iron transport system substrate-binding protein
MWILGKSLVLSVCMLAASSSLAETGNTEDKLKILTSTTQIADFVREVVGDRGEVHSVLAPGTDPHLYQPTPSDARAAADADLLFENGLHLEGKDWMRTLAGDAGKTVVTCTEGIVPLTLETGGEVVPDPHAWFDPANAAVYVNNITRALIAHDAGGEYEYAARAKLYLQQLRVLDSWIKAEVNVLPPDKRILVTSHDAFNYFARSYGFKNEAPVGWSTGRDTGGGMTPERRSMVVDSIKGFGVKSIFVETSVNPKAIREIAQEAGVAVGGELYSDSMGTVGSAGESYLGMMRENTVRIVAALR